MAGQWPKLIRDPIHNLIRFDANDLDRLLLDLIDCREFQRLRRIKQLGFSDTVFPGATHTRFAHSIGVMWNARRLLDHLGRTVPDLVDEHRQVVLIAALLHDLGHGPFSHAFEKVTNDKHEVRTVEIILGRERDDEHETEIHRRLADYDASLPDRVASVFPESLGLTDEANLGGYECPKALRDVVSSQLDADRWDYLLRDSHFSGTEYGRFDLAWLIDHLEIDADHDRLFLTRKAHHAVEEYIFARYHMYQAVYYHKATRASEVMLRLLFQRYRELLAQKDTERKRRNIVRDAPVVVVHAFSPEAISLVDYLLLDDHCVTQFLKAAMHASDKTLAYLGHGLLNRRLFKCVDATDAPKGETGDFVADAVRTLDKMNRKKELPIDGDLALQKDQPSDTAYRIYDPDTENPDTLIYVQRETQDIEELSQVSKQVDALKQKITQLRYYFPAEARDELKQIAEKHLQRRTA